MAASKFDEELELDAKPPVFEGAGLPPGTKHGPCAMGDEADGQSLTSVHVLLCQHAEGRVARATGVSGQSGQLTRADKPVPAGRWVVNTQLEKGSEQFVVGKPAFAMAMAFTERADGGIDIDRWGQAVTIVSR